MIPGSANALLLASAAEGGYQISRSLRFNSSDSAYLSRTPASAGNRKTWTFSAWVKRSKLGTNQALIHCRVSANTDDTSIAFTTSDTLRVVTGTSDAVNTNAVFRDASAWYHIVCTFDTTQATAANRIKLYVNGVEQAFASTSYPSQNSDWSINSTSAHNIGAYNIGVFYGDFYLADVHLIDGQALDPTSFTETDATTGQLIPKAYAGSYGTNGFHLPFSDNSTAAALGTDTSGNSNTWTVNNISVTAGAGNDSLVDTPTSYGTGNSGGDVRGNYATWNPLKGTTTFANGNLEASTTTGGSEATVGTVGMQSGKWYWEVTLTVSGTSAATIGIATNSFNATNYVGNDAGSWGYYSLDGNKYTNGSGSSYGTSYGNGDVIGVAFDADSGNLYFYKNGTVQNSGTAAYTSLTSGPYFPAVGDATSGGAFTFTLNAGQRPFAYTAPSGFKALCDTNLSAPVVAQPSTVMDVVTYLGNGTADGVTQTISGLSFSPDFVWIKSRSNAYSHNLYDAVRGVGKALISNATTAETTTDALTQFTSDGFTVKRVDSGPYYETNANNATYAAWTWDAGSTTASNPDGSITSSVRANASAGFSIVTYTGAGSAGTVGHGLGAAPGLVILKDRTFAAGTNWQVYHASIGNTSSINLNTTGTPNSDIGWWNNTSPTSTVFSVGTYNAGSSNYVAYCFAPVDGYSSAFSYTGNGASGYPNADGPYIHLGFRPRLILIKCSSAVENWVLYDTARSDYNYADDQLYPNLSNAEATGANREIDILSNGFKVRSNGGIVNTNAATYVGFAWAESPFQYARAR